MAVTKAGTDVEVLVKIQDGPDLSRSVDMFKNASFINNGYQIHVRVTDVNLSIFQELTNKKYLKEARKKPMVVEYSIGYTVSGDGSERRTEPRIAYITNLVAKVPPGGQTAGYFEFIAVDPPTWHLNKGDATGAVYKGNVSKVIEDLVKKYTPQTGVGTITVDVSNTNDNTTNKWYQMRQDPKTFLMTLLDWSSSITGNKTNWVVASVDKKIIIKEQAELESVDLGEYSVNVSYPSAENVVSWERNDTNYLSNIQTKIITTGISAISGLYCDPKNPITKDLTVVDDENTSAKRNVRITDEQGFTKPDDEDVGITMIRSVPEDNSGAVGIQYQQYIDGRARGIFIGSLDILSRLKVTVHGSHLFSDSSVLGASTVKLLWTDAKDEPWVGQGEHLVYGFEHVFTPDQRWYTNIYVNRKDFNAAARIV